MITVALSMMPARFLKDEQCSVRILEVRLFKTSRLWLIRIRHAADTQGNSVFFCAVVSAAVMRNR